jgi:molecular chaperone DnaK (HSP70)
MDRMLADFDFLPQQVLSTDGDTTLGGEDIDALLVRLFNSPANH